MTQGVLSAVCRAPGLGPWGLFAGPTKQGGQGPAFCWPLPDTQMGPNRRSHGELVALQKSVAQTLCHRHC